MRSTRSRDPRGSSGRRPRRPTRRGGPSLRGARGRVSADRASDHRGLSRAARELHGPVDGGVPGRAAQDGNGQDPQARPRRRAAPGLAGLRIEVVDVDLVLADRAFAVGEVPALADRRVREAAPNDVIRDEGGAVGGGEDVALVAHHVGWLIGALLSVPADEVAGIGRGATVDGQLRECDARPAHRLDSVLMAVALVGGTGHRPAADLHVVGTIETCTPSSQLVTTVMLPIDPVHPLRSLIATGVLFVIFTVTESSLTGPLHDHVWLTIDTEASDLASVAWAAIDPMAQSTPTKASGSQTFRVVSMHPPFVVQSPRGPRYPCVRAQIRRAPARYHRVRTTRKVAVKRVRPALASVRRLRST